MYPRDCKRYLNKLSEKERALVDNEFQITPKSTPIKYADYCQGIIELAIKSRGEFLPNLEFMAANIAYDNRKISALDLIAQRSQNHFVLIPHIKGMIARNSLARASANIRVLEGQLTIEDPLNQLELFLLKAMNASANGSLTDALFLTLAAKEFLVANENEIYE